MSYASPAWEFAADIYLMKLQRLQGAHRFAICAWLSKSRSYMITLTKVCRQQAEVIQNHDNENVRTIGQGEARHKKI
jgi:hypothetical protein